MLLAEGRAVGDKALAEYMEVKGYADAADWVYHQASTPPASTDRSLLTLTELRKVHRMAMTPVWDVAPHPGATPQEKPGSLRQHDIEAFPGGMRPPRWVLVPAEIDAWLDEVNLLRPRAARFPERLAQLHAALERTHPFLDGNGRTGRLVMNLLLVRLGYPPAVVYKRDRAILDNLYRFVVPAVAGPARLVPLAALAHPGITADALRTAAIRGRLQATRGPDGQWRSSRRWVDAYLASRYVRGSV